MEIYLDIELEKHGIRTHLQRIQKFTGIPHWVTLKMICSRKQFISHLCLYQSDGQWFLVVTYNRSYTKKFIRREEVWEESNI